VSFSRLMLDSICRDCGRTCFYRLPDTYKMVDPHFNGNAFKKHVGQYYYDADLYDRFGDPWSCLEILGLSLICPEIFGQGEFIPDIDQPRIEIGVSSEVGDSRV